MSQSLPVVSRCVLGAVFIAAGVSKIVHPAVFFGDLLSYRVPLPELFLRMVAVWLPWLEVAAGLGLLLDFWAETVRPVVAVLCLVFVVMLTQAVVRGLDLNCGCFGAGAAGWFERPGAALVRALILLVASLYLAKVRPPAAST